MKPVCVVDTCSLIYISEIELANRPLIEWLWDEFEIHYSQTVWEEIQNNLNKVGEDRAFIRRQQDCAYDFPRIGNIEIALFSSYYRLVEVTRCRTCQKPKCAEQRFEPDLEALEDKGERRNCCISLHMVINSEEQLNHRQVIFLTDDHRAMRDYVDPVFATFPLGHTWGSYDFILYVFLRHRNRITLDMAFAALREINAKIIGPRPEDNVAAHLHREWQQKYESWLPRLTEYRKKLRRMNRTLVRFQGGLR